MYCCENKNQYPNMYTMPCLIKRLFFKVPNRLNQRGGLLKQDMVLKIIELLKFMKIVLNF